VIAHVIIRHLITAALGLSSLQASVPIAAARASVPPPPVIGEPAFPSDSPPASPQYDGCGGVIVSSDDPDFEQQLLDLVNSARVSTGLPPLKRVASLDDAARYHAADMAQDGYFYHNSYDLSAGNLVEMCAWSVRVGSYYSGWNALAENIAAGYASPAAVMAGWMDSPGHRDNILSSSAWEIGIGYASGGPYGTYWVQDFGRRAQVYPLVINADAASSHSLHVNLYVYGLWDQMRLRNDSGAWSAWMAFQPSLVWALTPAPGLHTVSVELRKGVQTASSSDTIFLEVTTVPQPQVYIPLITK